MIQREVAHRIFAREYNASNIMIPGQGEKDPSFVLTPLGAKVNRLHVVGVCTDVEPVGEAGDVWRARISDPTGVFTVYAGQYQPEAAQVISQIEPPAFVAVTGKARTYEPEPGTVFCSIRPETVTIVDAETRDQWILETARRTTARSKSMATAKATPGGEADLISAGVLAVDAAGAHLALEHYGDVPADVYAETVRESVGYLLPGGEVPVHRVKAEDGEEAAAPQAAPAWTPPAAASNPAETAAHDELDDAVLAIVQGLEGDQGAQWDDIVGQASAKQLAGDDVEESLNRLMDKGLVYEPTLGVLRST